MHLAGEVRKDERWPWSTPDAGPRTARARQSGHGLWLPAAARFGLNPPELEDGQHAAHAFCIRRILHRTIMYGGSPMFPSETGRGVLLGHHAGRTNTK